jgi:short-subunit dehydrogenase
MGRRTIIMTGASDGIGAALARTLADRSTNLVLAARNEKKLRDVARQCEDAGAKTLVVGTDVADRSACQALVERAAATFEVVDVLVNNAGISMLCRFDQVQDLSMFDRLMQVNYLGAVYCTYYALPLLKKSHGLVVAISSLQGKTGFPLYTGYSASKHAMQGFFDSLRIELRGSGVDVLVVSPGPVATSIQANRLGGDGKSGIPSAPPGSAEMPVQECARQIARAIRGRRRELVMTGAGKLIGWMKQLAPAAVDVLVDRAVKQFHGMSSAGAESPEQPGEAH